jgi:hypothetical protein
MIRAARKEFGDNFRLTLSLARGALYIETRTTEPTTAIDADEWKVTP